MTIIKRTDRGIKVKLAHYTSSGRDWVAEITDIDEKYGFKREFLNAEKDWSSSGKTGWSYYELENGKVYEVNEPYKGRWFFQVTNGECVEISKEDVLEYIEQKRSGLLTGRPEEKQPILVDRDEEVYEENEDGILVCIQPSKVENDKAEYLISPKRTYVTLSQGEKGIWKLCLYLGGAARFTPKCVNLETKPLLQYQKVKDVVNVYEAISK